MSTRIKMLDAFQIRVVECLGYDVQVIVIASRAIQVVVNCVGKGLRTRSLASKGVQANGCI